MHPMPVAPSFLFLTEPFKCFTEAQSVEEQAILGILNNPFDPTLKVVSGHRAASKDLPSMSFDTIELKPLSLVSLLTRSIILVPLRD